MQTPTQHPQLGQLIFERRAGSGLKVLVVFCSILAVIGFAAIFPFRSSGALALRRRRHLRIHGDQKDRAALRRLAQSENVFIRRDATRALGPWGNKKSVEVLGGLVNHGDIFTQWDAIKALTY